MSKATARGIMLMFLSNIIFCCMAALVRHLADFNAWSTTLFRFITGIVIVGILAITGRTRLLFVNKPGLLLRGFTGGAATAIFYFSITKLGLLKAGFIAGLYPAFATIFSCLILKERLSKMKLISLAGAVAGVTMLVTAQNGTGQLSDGINRYDFIALIGTMLAGLSVVVIKKLQATETTSAIFFAQCCIGAGIVFIPASIGTVYISPAILTVLLVIGVLATAGQLLLTDSYRYLSVSTGSLIIMTVPIINCLLGLLFFKEPFSPLMACGALIILVATTGLIFERT